MGHDQTTRILAIRHGETAWNRDNRIQGFLDIALNDNGLAQAERLAESLADEAIDAVYSSDLQRAHATALPLARPRGLTVQLDLRLRERSFGVFEGRSFAELEALYPEETLRWRRRDPDFGPQGGERLVDFDARCIAAIARLAERHRGGCIAVVSHGGVMDCLYRAATRLSLDAPRTWTVANASINRVLHTPDGYSLIGWGDTSHLDGTPHSALDSLSARHALASAALDEGSDGGRSAAA
ncbi:histidine phosphatase family protein [Leptothrix discophora]|uniref:Histidine phosphatase family protein n=1 Tax=Leptothrix discophora TaxID=89 RepID=A0ABT9G5J6_LEPDI|nr:histidine phosphatase family protein [Leptothrix discophora]MDP4301676.1 histidine phosphatase family protein [Leptothrix discophora]